MENRIIASTTSTNSKPAIPGSKISWKGGPSIQQNFSLPSSIIYYISKNPSTSTQYLKLVQSCKYFFEKLPILVAYEIYEVNGEIKLCPYEDLKCNENENKCCVKIDFAKLSSSIWLTNSICFIGKKLNPNYISLLSTKVFRSDIDYCTIFSQNIKFDDFKFMVSSATEIIVYNSKIVYSDRSNVTLDAILEAVRNVKHFKFYCNSSLFGPSTLKNIAKLQNLSNLQMLRLYDIPEIPNVQDFFAVIKEHKNLKIDLRFDNNISDEFKNQLNVLIDVIQNGNKNFIIEYDGQDAEKLKVMKKRFYGY